MHTKKYVEKYRLNDLEYSNHFNTDLFLTDLNEEMMDRINKEKANRKSAGLEYSYRIFQIIIQEMQQKFCAISNKKVGGPLRPGLWSAFYAKYIIPIRATDFPEEHQKIVRKKLNYEKSLIKPQVIDEIGRDWYEHELHKAKETGNYETIDKIKAEIDAEVAKRLKALENKL